MVLELYVWGPAFGLPSVDAHCLAAIAYLQQAVPDGNWSLVVSSDPALCPVDELPALRNGDIWIGGFRNIFHYIAQVSAGEWVLDAGLPEQASADVIAYSSFIESHGQPLLDLSLYVSSLNYAVTRPIYTTIQHFPLPYMTPHALRTKAKQRTAYLGLSSLDIDDEADQSRVEDSIIPDSLRRPKTTVSSLLHASPEKNSQIRLHALATTYFQPLQKLKGDKKFLVSDSQISSLDCLALGFLCLMLVADLPQPWLGRTLREEFPDLCSWAENLKVDAFGRAASVEDIPKISQEDSLGGNPRSGKRYSLPWKLSKQNSRQVVGIFFSRLITSIPGVGHLMGNGRVRFHGGRSPIDAANTSSWHATGAIGTAIVGICFTAYAVTRRR